MIGTRQARTPSGWLFVALTYAGSWALWLPLAFAREPSFVLLTAGSCVPSLLGILFAMLRPAEPRRTFWRRTLDPRRISARWYAIILLTFPLITALSFLLVRARGGVTPPLDNLVATLTDPRLLSSLLVIEIVGGPIAEELGWRGYLLDRFQLRWPALKAALLLWLVWTTWHLPLFFIPGTVQADLGFPSWGLLLFYLQILGLTLIIHAAYNGNSRSTLAAILAHFIANLSWTIVPGLGVALPLSLESTRAMLLLLVAFFLVIRFRRLPSRRFPKGIRGV